MILTEELIRKKRDGLPLDAGEIGDFVRGVSDGRVTDAQIAAFAMAVWFRGMSVAEPAKMTATDVDVFYGDTHAIVGVSLEIRRDEVMALIIDNSRRFVGIPLSRKLLF